MIRITRYSLPLLLALTIASYAQQPDPSTLTLERIFSSKEFTSQPFDDEHWLEKGAAYAMVEPSPSVKDGKDIVRYETGSGRRTILVSAGDLIPSGETKPLDIDEFEWSADGTKLLIFTNSVKVWRVNTRGDYWVLTLTGSSKKLQKLGGDAKPSTLMFAAISPDGKQAAYVRENNLYAERLEDSPQDKKITQLTHDGSRTIINGTSDWVYEEEFDLRIGWHWSPDSRSIAYWQFNTEGIREFDLINNTDSLYPVIKPVQYPKAGQPNSAVRIGVVSADGGEPRWLEPVGDPRNSYIPFMDWAGNSEEIVLQHVSRKQNRFEVMLVDARTGRARTVLTEEDEAWIDFRTNDFHWLEGGKAFTWTSEHEGWRQAYVVSRDGKSRRLVTPRGVDVISIDGVDEKGGWLYYTASPENATQRYLFRARLDGSGKAERVTPAAQAGSHIYRVSPDAAWAFHIYSRFDTPQRIELVRLPAHSVARVVLDNAEVSAKLERIRRKPPEFFRVDVGNGVQLDGWMIKPPDFDQSKRYPVLFFVYGEPMGQMVVDRWGEPTYLWHAMLAQQGYIVICVDNRGTPSPRGRAWRKVIYRKIGVIASEDQAGAVRAIAKWPFVDASRIGIWGWSGGGSMTLNMMFRYPDLYRMGMAVAPVTDLHYYDTIYEERYMGLPQENEEDYKRSSPITFAGQLKGRLLLVHGTGDDNVNYQNTEALINALVAANKAFTLMSYPNRTHSISEGEGTTRHLFELLTRYLHENLPAGPGGGDSVRMSSSR